jgi:hypothetical protein
VRRSRTTATENESTVPTSTGTPHKELSLQKQQHNSSIIIMSSQPEWMKVYNQMGLKNQVVTTVDKESGAVIQSGPSTTTTTGGGVTSTDASLLPTSPSRFDKFEHKVKPDPNASTPPWLANLKKNQQLKKATAGTTTSTLVPSSGVVVVQDDDDAAALFAKAGSAPAAAARGGGDDEDAAALFHGVGTTTSTATAPRSHDPADDEVSSRYRKMIQMGT